MNCSICGRPITNPFGNHNAQPVNDGRCCSECNDAVVIPHRMRRMGIVTRRKPKETKDDK
jgi:hypothetical protein